MNSTHILQNIQDPLGKIYNFHEIREVIQSNILLSDSRACLIEAVSPEISIPKKTIAFFVSSRNFLFTVNFPDLETS
jgi:hypothetical protein